MVSNESLHIHLDLVGGIAGDMFLAAAIDAGLVEPDHLTAQLRKVGLGPVEVVVDRVVRGAIEGTKVEFRGWDRGAEAEHRHLSTIRRMLADSDLSQPVKNRATAMFERLGRAEAAVHGMELDEVHFHEVGAVDSILDFVGVAWIIEEFDDASWSFGVVPAGTGTIETAHGTIPVPAPATAKVLEGLEVEYRDVESEFVTPTGATILATVAARKGRRSGRMKASGFGCGSRQVEGISNVLRMVVLNASEQSEFSGVDRDDVVQLVTEIDDELPEVTAHIAELLLEQGALDVVCEAVQMKKGRIGRRLNVLCRPHDEPALVRRIFEETTTFGIRRLPVQRWVLRRELDAVSTSFGEVDVKVGRWGDEVLKVSPEYDSCADAAERSGVPIREVYNEVLSAARNLFDDG